MEKRRVKIVAKKKAVEEKKVEPVPEPFDHPLLQRVVDARHLLAEVEASGLKLGTELAKKIRKWLAG